MPSSTSSSSPFRVPLQLAAGAGGFLLSLALVWILDRTTELWPALDVDPSIGRKWAAPPETPRPFFYLQPRVPTGGRFHRRRGPRTERGNILRLGAEAAGITDHPYGDLPPVTVRYGRHGFRIDSPAVPGGTALVGSSYVEAGFADAGDTMAGWLRRDHDIPASNFGMAMAGGYASLHFLRRYVAPTRPKHVVWVVSDRFDFSRLLHEAKSPEGARRTRPKLEGLGTHLVKSPARFLRSGARRLRQAARRVSSLLIPLESSTPAKRGRERPRIRLGDRHVEIGIFFPPPGPVLEEASPHLDDVLDRMARFCAGEDIRLVVALIPSRFTLVQDLLVDPVDPPYPLPDTTGVLREACRKRGIPFVDPTEALRRALRNGTAVFNPVHDAHLNSAGMRIVSRRIARTIRSGGN